MVSSSWKRRLSLDVLGLLTGLCGVQWAAAAGNVFLVLGAVIGTGDFVYSMLTDNPNRKSIAQVASFIEGKSEAYRVWLVLIKHWMELSEEGETTASTAEGTATGGALEEAERVEGEVAGCMFHFTILSVYGMQGTGKAHIFQNCEHRCNFC